MIDETNAAIEGALAGGATDILVNDSHGSMYNLLPVALHPAARVLQGQKAVVDGRRRPGPGAGFDVALFVGYHARAGHPTGTIAHTYSGAPVETRLDGRPTGEYGLNALALGAWGVPVGLVAGDDALAEEVEAWLPWAERVVVKTAAGGHAAASVHPAVACDLVRAGRRAGGPAGRRRRAASSCASGRRSSSRSTTAAAVEADYAALVPGAERVGDRGVRYAADDPIVAYRGFLAGNRLAGTVDLSAVHGSCAVRGTTSDAATPYCPA